MELDRTEIVIRQRGCFELLDLSLLVIKTHFPKLLLTGAILGLPLMLCNLLLISWMISEDAILAAENSFSADTVVWWRYVSHLCILATMQFPIASIPITLFLGAQIFFLPITVRELLGHLWSLKWPVIFILGILRLALVGIVIELAIRRQFDFGPLEAIFLFAIFPVSLIARTFVPFAPEIIGLERCPLRAKSNDQISYSKRKSSLHGPLQGDLLIRMLAAIFFGLLLLAMTVGATLFFKAIISGGWNWNKIFSFAVLPASLWLVGIFLAVFRYLSYIDSRIRLEGWEIELRLRAEAGRLQENSQSVGTTAAAGSRSTVLSGANP